MELTILGITLITVPVTLLIVAFLAAVSSWRSEKEDAEYLREFLSRTRTDLTGRAEFWRDRADSQGTRLIEAYQELEGLRTTLEETAGAVERADKARDFWYNNACKLSDEVNAESHRREVAETAVDFLVEKVVDLVDEVGELESDLEEAEEESDDMEESAREATEGWQASNNLTTRIIEWGERVLDVLERYEERLEAERRAGRIL